LDAVGLTDFANQSPQILSGGEKRRLAIAGVLAMNPRIIAFDEPFSNLDYPGVRQVLRHMLLLHQTGHTILVATHDLEKVICHTDHLIVMNKGKIVKSGPPDEIISSLERFGVRMPCAYRFGFRPEPFVERI
jgi:biotin transport system ATP-binding protein